MLSLGLGSQPTTECGIFGSYQCLELDGDSDYVTLPSTLISQMSYESGTISCWVDLRDNNGGTSQNIVFIKDDSSNDGMILQFHRGNTEFRAIYRLDGVYKEATWNDASLDLAGYMNEGWIHLAMTWENDGGGSGEVKIYQNGVIRETVAQNTAPVEGNALDISRIGSNDDASSGLVDGFVDQVAIYNTVKTANDIARMADTDMTDLTMTKDHRTAPYSPSGLVAYYQFEGNALDSSGNGHHGTLVGTAGFNSTQP